MMVQAVDVLLYWNPLRALTSGLISFSHTFISNWPVFSLGLSLPLPTVEMNVVMEMNVVIQLLSFLSLRKDCGLQCRSCTLRYVLFCWIYSNK